MVWECLLRKIVVIFSGRQDVNHSEHVAIINRLLGWEMLSDNDMCSFPGSQESSHGDICQHAAQTYSDLSLLFVSQNPEEWNRNNFLLLWVFECFLPLNSLSGHWCNVSSVRQRVMTLTIWSDTPPSPWWADHATGHITRDEHVVITITHQHIVHTLTPAIIFWFLITSLIHPL